MANEQFELLTIRSRNCLMAEGLFTKQQVEALFHIDYTKSELRKIPNLGRKTHKEIAWWLGVSNEVDKVNFNIKDILLRDYFAAKAIQNFSWIGENDKECAVSCYEIADAMMEARKNVS
jgi:hypothetical protein